MYRSAPSVAARLQMLTGSAKPLPMRFVPARRIRKCESDCAMVIAVAKEK